MTLDLEGLKALTIEDSEDYMGLVAVLHDVLDEREREDLKRKVLAEPHYKAFKEVNALYTKELEALALAAEEIKGKIEAFRAAQERAQDEAIAHGLPVAAMVTDPPGVYWKPEVTIFSSDMEKVPERFLKVVLDTEALAEHFSQGGQAVEGITCQVRQRCIFRRSKETK